MLRTSLRSSQKLQQLANKPVPSGVVNEAFAVEDTQAVAAAAAAATSGAAAAAAAGGEAKSSEETPSKVIGKHESGWCQGNELKKTVGGRTFFYIIILFLFCGSFFIFYLLANFISI